MLPVVSVICCAYNHGPYIRQCLDGFMMQKTDFSFEVLIHDDASTDNTAEIIREYELKYPDTIFPIYATQNKYSKGIDVFSQILLPKAKGKYIAICEGDDYWTDPQKLQKQVDILDSNLGYVMCSHVVDVYNERTESYHIWGVQDSQEYDIYTLVYGPWLYHPLSVLFRKSAFNSDKYSCYKLSKDMTLFYHILSSGKGYYMSEHMAVYRRHNNGVWSGATLSQRISSNFRYGKDLYDVEKTNLALAFLCEACISEYGRYYLLKHLRVSIKVWCIYTCHYGVIAGLRLLLYRYILGKDYCPWRRQQ